MKKLLCCIMVLVALFQMLLFSNSVSNSALFNSEDFESLTATERLESVYMGFESAVVWYDATSSMAAVIGMNPELAVEQGYVSMVCCINAETTDVGCDFSIEADECKRRVVRRGRK